MEAVDKFSLKEKSKWFDLSLVILVMVLMGVLVFMEKVLGLSSSTIGVGKSILILLISAAIVIVVHEGLHGLFFRLFGGKVSFGFKWTRIGPAAYSTSPNFYPRLKFQAIALAPQILTLILLILLKFFTSPILMYAFIVGIICNLGGGCLDLYLAVWLRKFPRTFLVKDIKAGGVEVYK